MDFILQTFQVLQELHLRWLTTLPCGSEWRLMRGNCNLLRHTEQEKLLSEMYIVKIYLKAASCSPWQWILMHLFFVSIFYSMWKQWSLHLGGPLKQQKWLCGITEMVTLHVKIPHSPYCNLQWTIEHEAVKLTFVGPFYLLFSFYNFTKVKKLWYRINLV